MVSSKAINGIKYWGQLLGIPVYWLSFLVPRNKRIWLFGSTFGRRFADNPRYLYLYLSQHKEEIHVNEKTGRTIRPVWISHKKEIVNFLAKHGYEAYHYHSLKGIWYCLRGKTYIFDNYSKDISFWLSGGAKKINLWHGIPLKKIQADNVFDCIRHPKSSWDRVKSFPRRLSDEKPSHYVLTTSKYLVPIFSSAFRTENVLTSGYPRNDRLISDQIKNLLTEEENADRKYIEHILYSSADRKKMVYYMPTFRDSEIGFFKVIDLNKFQQFLRDNHILFCVKLHPKSKLRKQFEVISGDNIFVINADSDPYVFLEMADVLVTDYSSIYFDFLLTDKPIVFFDYDLEEYLENSREMYFDYEEFTPGEKAVNQRELQEAIARGCIPDNEYDCKYAAFRKAIRDKVFENGKEMAAPRLVKDIGNMLGGVK